MSENGTNGVQPAVVDDSEDLEKKELELKRKARDPPIVFQDVINVGTYYIASTLILLLSCRWTIVGSVLFWMDFREHHTCMSLFENK